MSSRIEPKSDKEAIPLCAKLKPSSLGKNSLLLVRLFTNPALVTTYVLNSKISSKSCNRSLLLLPSFKIILSMIWRKKIFTMVHKKLSLKVQCTFLQRFSFIQFNKKLCCVRTENKKNYICRYIDWTAKRLIAKRLICKKANVNWLNAIRLHANWLIV